MATGVYIPQKAYGVDVVKFVNKFAYAYKSGSLEIAVNSGDSIVLNTGNRLWLKKSLTDDGEFGNVTLYHGWGKEGKWFYRLTIGLDISGSYDSVGFVGLRPRPGGAYTHTPGIIADVGVYQVLVRTDSTGYRYQSGLLIDGWRLSGVSGTVTTEVDITNLEAYCMTEMGELPPALKEFFSPSGITLWEDLVTPNTITAIDGRSKAGYEWLDLLIPVTETVTIVRF